MTTQSVDMQTFCESPEWWYFFRHFINPEYNEITLGSDRNQHSAMIAQDIFAAMKFDIEPLRKVKGADRFWLAFAKATNKTIHAMKGFDEYTYQEMAVYYPDGRMVANPNYPSG